MLTIATCRRYPEAPENLHGLARALRARGVSVGFRPWQDFPLTPFLLPLCAWDYAAAPQQFEAWLDAAAQAGSRFANPPALMRWNMHKRYLCDLAARGADVIPTRPAAPQESDVRRIMAEEGWREAVLKPAVGQSGRGVVRIGNGAAVPDWAEYRYGAVVQPFVPAVESAGETSLVFFGGRFSHAVLRRPPPGEWRANSAYGVAVSAAEPPAAALRAAETVLVCLPETPAYARVDGTFDQSRFLLNELELIEPALYLHTAAGAAERFAAVLAAVYTS